MQRFALFTDDDVQRIHGATLQILEEVGIDFGYEPAVAALAEAGCRVEGERVFFPPRLVEAAVAQAPAQFTLHGRNPDRNVIIGGGHMVCAPCYGPPVVCDLDGGRRESTLADFVNFVKLAHSSPNQDMIGGVMAEPNDIPLKQRNAEMMYAALRYSDKPFFGGVISGQAARETIAMAAMAFGGEAELANTPPCIGLISTRTPLGLDDRMLEALMIYARAGMPLLIASLTIAGATGPVTMEGTLVVQNAEVLAGIVLTQTIRPGTPVVMGGSSTSSAMRYGTLSIGAPENAINVAATAQMARFYNLPCRSGGSLTDAKTCDCQSAAESMMNHLMATVSGINLVLHSAGILESYMVSSYEKFILDDDIAGMCKRIKRGAAATPEKLAADIIAQAGPGGEYLTLDHTFDNFRTEFFTPQMEERSNYDAWAAAGSVTMEKRANARWKEILAAYREPGLPDEIGRQLDEYMAQVRNT